MEKNQKLLFIEKCQKIHNNKYDYSKVNYINIRTKVEIICPVHGSFFQIPKAHQENKGCPKCAGRIFSAEDIINKFKTIHGDKYDYSKVEYKNSKEKVEIICPVHGSFFQTPGAHINSRNGCPKCKNAKLIKHHNNVLDDFNTIHGDKYDYSKVEYKSSKEKVEIICPVHGSFFQTPGNHLQGNNCPKCSHLESKSEKELYEWISSYIPAENCNRTVIAPKELDIFIPSKNVAFEYNGLLWHSEKYKHKNYHLDKLKLCNDKNVRLIQIFEDEWLYKQKIVKSRIKHVLGLTTNKIYARKCVVSKLDNNECDRFLEKYHIQGSCAASVKFGLYYKTRLVAVMTFGKSRFNKNYQYELLRYCTVANFNVVGGASKLLCHFRKIYKGNMISYADKRWSNGNLYKQLGFEELKDSAPNYYYIKGYNRLSRNKFQKHKLEKQLSNFNNKLSEVENMRTNGYYRIFDCGNKVFVLK